MLRHRKVLKQSGVSAAEAISISDEIRDLDASVQEKIPFGAVAWGYTNIDAPHSPCAR